MRYITFEINTQPPLPKVIDLNMEAAEPKWWFDYTCNFALLFFIVIMILRKTQKVLERILLYFIEKI